MTVRSKLSAKLKNKNSDATWTMAEVTKILADNGWILDSIKGSHHKFASPGKRPIVVATHEKSIKPGYIKMIRQTLLE